jgi:hypothetical protein
MALTLLSAWWIGSESARTREAGFWVSLASNAAWCVWGFHDRAWAVIGMQVGLAILNIRGALKNKR